MEKFAFVILHYKTIDETIACIESILQTITYANYEIVIVDNGSKDGTGEGLKEKYQVTQNIHVIISQDNLGFAKGNNLGYKFSKNELMVDFIAIINNDTIIEQANFIEKTLEIYEKEKFYLLGPDIVTYNDTHQNPLEMNLITLEEIDYFLKIANKDKWIKKIEYAFPFSESLIKGLVKIKHILLNQKKKKAFRLEEENLKLTEVRHYAERHEGVVLQGAAIIYSPLFIIKEDEAFYPRTFMYVEELILAELCRQKGYKTVYTPELSIFHKHEASTKNSMKSYYKKLDFFYENKIKGYLILKGILEKEKQK